MDTAKDYSSKVINLLSVRKCNGKAGRLPYLCRLLDQNKMREEAQKLKKFMICRLYFDIILATENVLRRQSMLL